MVHVEPESKVVINRDKSTHEQECLKVKGEQFGVSGMASQRAQGSSESAGRRRHETSLFGNQYHKQGRGDGGQQGHCQRSCPPPPQFSHWTRDQASGKPAER